MGLNRFFGASILSLAILAGCGGGGDGTAPATGGGGAGGGGGTTTSGQLTNSPIDGVPYTAAPSGLTGTTMNGGMFNFQAGDTVTFNIAGLEIAVPGGARITPQTIAEELADGNATTQANILANLTTLFQTIDSDGNAENGSILIPDGVTLGNLQTLSGSLASAPGTFAPQLTSAISNAEGYSMEMPAPTAVVDSVEAMLRFYRNELQGNWRLLNTVENGGAPITTNNDYQVLLSFDVGNENAADTEVVNSFIFSEFDLTEVSQPDDEPYSFIGVGTTNYDPESGDLQFTSLPTRRLREGLNLNSSTEDDNVLFTSKVTLQGNQLVLVLTEERLNDETITIVATFERFNNVKDSLVGTWYEVLPPETFEGAPTTVSEPARNGSVDFGDDVAAVFYYFLSDSRVMLVFTDLPASDAGEEANGVIVADYTVSSDDVLTFDTIVLDSVSTFPNSNPAVGGGDSVTLGEVDLNDTKRVLIERDLMNIQDEYVIYRILSLSERVGDFVQSAR